MSPRSKPVNKKEPIDIKVDDIKVEQDGLELTVLKIQNKRLSLALYHQIPTIHIIDYSKSKCKKKKKLLTYSTDTSYPIIKGKVIGKVSTKIRGGNGHHSCGRYYEEEGYHFDILWKTKSGSLAVCPISWIVEDLRRFDDTDLPNHINIFNNSYLCNLKTAAATFDIDYGQLDIEQWYKHLEIPERPKQQKLNSDYRGGQCGLTNNDRIVIIEELKKDIVAEDQYDKDMKEWAKTAHPIYDEFIEQITPIVIRINQLTKYRNDQYRKVIEEFNSHQQIFVGS